MNPIEIVAELLFGWFAFAARVLPDVSVRWDGVAMFAAGFVVSLVCARSLLNWLARERRPEEAAAAPRWTWRATASVLTMFLLVFVVGISLVGITHQAVWLGTSPEPWHDSATQSAADSERSIYRPGQIVPTEKPGNWITAIMPYASYTLDDFGRRPLDHEKAWNSPENAGLFKRPMPLMINPSLEVPSRSPDGFGLSHFAGNAAVLGGAPKRLDDLDGQTMMVAEVSAGFVPWGHPNQCRELKRAPSSDRPHGSTNQPLGFGPVRGRNTVMTLLVDGSVREVRAEKQ
ncbi:MAG TPA: hypothetical protein PLV92_22010 [Pirellulaceae bacterium]|nr:hypothetical protein [Pirellulaceae bacterium]